MLQVDILDGDSLITWRREYERKWYLWDSTVRGWKLIVDDRSIDFLEIGYKYGGHELRWQNNKEYSKWQEDQK